MRTVTTTALVICLACAFSNVASGASDLVIYVPVPIKHAEGETTVKLNQKTKPAVNDLLEPIGTFRFEKGRAGHVEISNEGTSGYVVIDAVQLIEVPEP